jgi:hypothetical protein
MADEHPLKPDEQIILNAALTALEDIGLHGTVMARLHNTPDAAVTIHNGKTELRYVVAIKTVDRRIMIDAVKREFDYLNVPCLLVAPHITAELAEYCREQGIQFIDTAGNAYLKAEGLHIFVTGQKRNMLTMRDQTDRAATTAGMRVLFVLLCNPKLAAEPYRTIARDAGVALGTVKQVITALQKRGHLLGPDRRLVNTKRLVEEWTINYPLQLRCKLFDANYVDRTITGNVYNAHIMRRFAGQTDDWWKKTELYMPKYHALWGGEIAADILTNYRKPGLVTVYVPEENIAKFIIDQRLCADKNGTVEILQKFWNFGAPTDRDNIVPPLLAYADLMATQDPRNHEVAKLIYEQHLAHDYD